MPFDTAVYMHMWRDLGCTMRSLRPKSLIKSLENNFSPRPGQTKRYDTSKVYHSRIRNRYNVANLKLLYTDSEPTYTQFGCWEIVYLVGPSPGTQVRQVMESY